MGKRRKDKGNKGYKEVIGIKGYIGLPRNTYCLLPSSYYYLEEGQT